MTVDDLRRLHAYNLWATGALLDAADRATAEQLTQPLGSSFGTLLGTLQHMLGAEWVWLERFNGRSPASFPGADGLTTIAAIRRLWDEVSAGLDAVIAATPDLDRAVAYRTFKGDSFAQPLGDLLQHVFNHGSYHRGQVAMSLRLLGLPAPSTDLVAFQRLVMTSGSR
jgi:uncharacterized damage-inducible protein DinB